MAKKPARASTISEDDLTDDEIKAQAAEPATEAVVEVAPVVEMPAIVGIVTTDKPAIEPAKFFVTSMNQGSLAEANRMAREARARDELAISDAYRAAIVAVNNAFRNLTPVLSVEEAVLVGK